MARTARSNRVPEAFVVAGSAAIPWSDAAGWNAPQYYQTIRAGDVDGDGEVELLARSSAGIDTWKLDRQTGLWQPLALASPAWSDATGWAAPQFYSTILVGDVNGDGRDEILARAAHGIDTWRFDGTAFQMLSSAQPAWSDAAGWGHPQFYATMRLADVDGDGRLELLARAAAGVETCKFDVNDGTWKKLATGMPPWTDGTGWNAVQFYSTILLGDINGDGRDEILARAAHGVDTWGFDGVAWRMIASASPAWSDADGWAHPQYYSTMRLADIDGDGRDELMARGASGITTYKFDSANSVWVYVGGANPDWSDAAGWGYPQFYSTIALADVNGDGKAELMARAAIGWQTWSFDGTMWVQIDNANPAFRDQEGWDQPGQYQTFRTGRYNGADRALLSARSKAGVYAYVFGNRGPTWEQFPGLGPIPPATSANIQKVKDNLLNMDSLVNRYHDWFQDDIQILYQLIQVVDSDPGQKFANLIISTSFKAIGAAPIPGAGAISGVLGGIFNYVSTDNPWGNLNRTFANVLLRFNANLMDLNDQIALYRDDPAKYWTSPLTNPATGEEVVLGDLASVTFPGPATTDFQTLLKEMLKGARYDLWKEVLPQRWNDVSVMNPPDLTFQSEAEVRKWIKGYVDKNPSYYITYYQGDATWPVKGKVWRVDEQWLGYGFFPFGHHEAPAALCEQLFQDDGLGTIVRPKSVTTRAEVFKSWKLPEQHVVMPTYGPYAAEIRAAIAASQASGRPVALSKRKLPGVVLQRASLRQADLSESTLSHGQFAGADLEGANLVRADLSAADFSNARLAGAKLAGAGLKGAHLQFADATGADFGGARLDGANVHAARLRGANLAGACLSKAVLRGADLRDADLSGADLSGADLVAADLRGARLGDADLDGAHVRGADFSGSTIGAAKGKPVDPAFATGLAAAPAGRASRTVRCLAGADIGAAAIDKTRFRDVAQDLADITLQSLAGSFASTVESFADALAVFAEFSVPLTRPSTTQPGQALALTCGLGGPDFYKRVAADMKARGVSAEKAAELGAAGKATAYPPLGYRVAIVGAGEEAWAQFQGPTAVAEVRQILELTGGQNASAALEAAAASLDRSSVALTSLDFSAAARADTQFFFVALAGDASVAIALLNGLKIDWPQAAAIERWLARTTAPYLVSAGVVGGVSGYQVGLYVPAEAERFDDVLSLLDAEGKARLEALGDLVTLYPIEVSYIGIVREPDGGTRVFAQVAYD